VHADRDRTRGRVAHVVDIAGAERPRPARPDRLGQHLTGRLAAGHVALHQGAPHHRERASRPAVIVEAGGLARQPADDPYLVAVVEVDLLVPAAGRIQPDPREPFPEARRDAPYHVA